MNRNRTAGHAYERQILRKLKELFPDIVTSRSESRRTDDAGVDFCFTKPFNFQCKLSINKPSYDVLERMPEGKNVVIHGHCQKANKNFIKKEDYVIMKLDTFLDLI